MKAIRKRRNVYALLLVAGVFLSAGFAVMLMSEAAFIFGTASAGVLVLFLRQIRLLYDARLIWDNRILAVSSAVISVRGSVERKDTEETVVSTFGVLIGAKIYKWGCDGIGGSRLRGVEIDRERIYLSFGNESEILELALLHGMAHLETVISIRNKLWHETGVEATVSGW